MALFVRLFHIFDKNKAHKDLLEEYSLLNEIALALAQNLEVLREMQKEIVEAQLQRVRYTKKFTGTVALEKTIFIEEELVSNLKKLAEIAERKFLAIKEEIETIQPIDPEEKRQLQSVFSYLNKIKNLVPDIVVIKNKSNNEKLQIVETRLREITSLSKEFYEEQKVFGIVVRKVKEHEISRLLKTIYTSPERLPGNSTFLLYKVSMNELRALEEESERINSCQDPNYRIEWARWWRDVQIPEVDRTTPLKNPHINVTIKLFGGPRKGVHLLLKSA